MNETLESLKTIQWLVGNALLTTEEEGLLKDMAFNAPAATARQVLEELKEAQWLAGNNRLNTDELARLKGRILAPLRSGPPSSAGQETIRLAAPGQVAAPDAPWQYLVLAWADLGLGGTPGPADLQSSLAGYGADGWELAGVVAPPGGLAQPWLVFKRPAQPA